MDKILKLTRKIEPPKPAAEIELVMDQSNLIELKPKQSLFNAPLANGNPKFAPSFKVQPTPIENIPRREPEQHEIFESPRSLREPPSFSEIIPDS